jgi:hypothetical protein
MRVVETPWTGGAIRDAARHRGAESSAHAGLHGRGKPAWTRTEPIKLMWPSAEWLRALGGLQHLACGTSVPVDDDAHRVAARRRGYGLAQGDALPAVLGLLGVVDLGSGVLIVHVLDPCPLAAGPVDEVGAPGPLHVHVPLRRLPAAAADGGVSVDDNAQMGVMTSVPSRSSVAMRIVRAAVRICSAHLARVPPGWPRWPP